MSRRERVRIMLVLTRMNVGGPAYDVTVIGGRLDPERYDPLLVHGRLGPGEGSFEFLAERESCRAVKVPELGPEISPREDVAAVRALRALIRTHRPHIVHTHTAKAGFAGRIAATLPPGPRPAVLHTYHGHVLEGYFGSGKNALYRTLERSLARRSDALVGVSNATIDDLVRLGVAPREQFRLVPYGLNLDRFVSPDQGAVAEFRRGAGVGDGELLLGFVGRLVPIKRVDVLLRAFAILRSDGVPVRLAIVGDGEVRAEMEQLAGKLGVVDAVRFTGFVDDPSAAAAAADIAVLSSDNEGTPIALIESGAAGRPAAATSVGGVPDVVAPSGGPLVPAGDHEALAGAIRSLVEDPQRRTEVGARAKRHVLDRFSVERMLRDISAVYDELAARRVGAHAGRKLGARADVDWM